MGNLNRLPLTWTLVCAVSLVLVTRPVAAQYTTASLGGTVTDASGAAIPGAAVTVRHVETGFTQTLVTNAAGAYLFPRLPIGTYTLRVELEGFAPYQQTNVQLTVDQAATQNVALQVEQLTEVVTVGGGAELIPTRTATAGQLVNQKQIEELPLEGRRPERLIYLAAGTVDLGRNGCRICGHGGVYPGQETAGAGGTQMGQVNFQLDGTSSNDTYLNAGLPFPNPDSVQEFSVQTSNFTAEYGNAGGAILNIVTRSGTNNIEGTWFHFLRDGRLNSRDFFAPERDQLKRNQFGGSIGGPIVKNKLFFFGTYQGTRMNNTPAGLIQFVPTAEQRRGDFSAVTTQLLDPVTGQPLPNNQIPADRLNEVSRFFLDRMPLPNGPDGQLTFPGLEIDEAEDQFMPKIDYVAGRHQLSGRYFVTDFSRPAGIPGPDDNILQARGGNAVRVQNVSINYTFTASPTLLFNSTIGLNRQRGGSLSGAPFSFRDAGSDIMGPQDLTLPFVAPPALNLSASGGFDIGTSHKGDFNRGDFTIRQVVTNIRGAHELRAGFELVRVSNENINTFQTMGNFEFTGDLSGNAFADFMFGRATTFTQGGGEFKDLLGTKWGVFVQDNWRVNDRLALNLGLRWDPYLPYYDREGRVVCFQPDSGLRSNRFPNAPEGLLYGGDPGCPTAGSEANWQNIGPRLGLAYRLTEDGKTSLRTGAGVYYTPPATHTMNPYTNIAPFAGTFTVNDVAFDDPWGSVGIPNPFPENFGPDIPGPDFVFGDFNAIRGYRPIDFRVPQLITWNLRLERQLGDTWVASLAYLGNKGTFLPVNVQENPAVYIPGASTVANTQERRIYPSFGPVTRTDSGANAHYHALQWNVEKRFSGGYSILANYTWSKMIDDADATNPFDRRGLGRGLSTEDVRHNVKFSSLYELPTFEVSGLADKLLNGWQLNSILIWQSGLPFTVVSGQDNSFSGAGDDRADFLGGDTSLGSGRSRGEQVREWFDTSKFTANEIGTFGNAGRNSVTGPSYFKIDLGVIKRTRLSGRMSLEFRAEAFNLLNTPNFAFPDADVSSAQFGRITSTVADNQRIIQLGVKVAF
ncbi:MAG: carboxypeptidase regulatory-like domain-containing protein [Vicinamibacteraceae bacterium]